MRSCCLSGLVLLTVFLTGSIAGRAQEATPKHIPQTESKGPTLTVIGTVSGKFRNLETDELVYQVSELVNLGEEAKRKDTPKIVYGYTGEIYVTRATARVSDGWRITKVTVSDPSGLELMVQTVSPPASVTSFVYSTGTIPDYITRLRVSAAGRLNYCFEVKAVAPEHRLRLATTSKQKSKPKATRVAVNSTTKLRRTTK